MSSQVTFLKLGISLGTYMANSLEKFLKEQIPLSGAMEVKILSATSEGVEIFAPLKPNINHVGTAFGGSLHAILLLSCYAWFLTAVEKLNEKTSAKRKFHILLKSSSTEYLLPVTSDIKAICKSPPKADLDKFYEAFSKKGKGRLNINAEVTTNEGVACKLVGEFVALSAK